MARTLFRSEKIPSTHPTRIYRLLKTVKFMLKKSMEMSSVTDADQMVNVVAALLGYCIIGGLLLLLCSSINLVLGSPPLLSGARHRGNLA